MGIKQEIMGSLETLPDEATIEDIKYHLYFVLMIKERLADTHAPTLPHEEVKERMKRWLK